MAYHSIAGDTRVGGDSWRVGFHSYLLYVPGVTFWQGVSVAKRVAAAAFVRLGPEHGDDGVARVHAMGSRERKVGEHRESARLR